MNERSDWCEFEEYRGNLRRVHHFVDEEASSQNLINEGLPAGSMVMSVICSHFWAKITVSLALACA